MALQTHILPCLQDNYVYILRDETQDFTAVIDPSAAPPVRNFLAAKGWHLNAILNTHHHWDHTDGNLELAAEFSCDIYGWSGDAKRIRGITKPVDAPGFSLNGHECQVLLTPGHTLGGVCFYFPEIKSLFSGDTFFSFGCGRLFEGSPEIMKASLEKLRQLPPDTLVYCGHEYTQNNLEFALSLEPQHPGLSALREKIKTLREKNQPTVPFLLSQEMELSPFLRWGDAQLRKALKMESASDLEVFTWVRTLRNNW